MDIGTRLREARERQGKSLGAVAQATKIASMHLEALESNRFSGLPGGIFARAFVRTYARELGLEPDPLVAEFVQRCPGAAPESLEALEAAAPPRSNGVRWVALLGALAVLAAAATGTYLWVASTTNPGRSTAAIERGTR
jgi:cytoskeletal protein RodZ